MRGMPLSPVFSNIIKSDGFMPGIPKEIWFQGRGERGPWLPTSLTVTMGYAEFEGKIERVQTVIRENSPFIPHC